MNRFIADLYNLFFPSVCQSCQVDLTTNELLICLRCRADLPLAGISGIANNELESMFFGQAIIEYATSLFRYEQDGIVQRLIHRLKYKGQEELSQLFGQWMGEELTQCSRLPSIDVVVPVPLSRSKLKTRGYNQVHGFGQEIAYSLKATFVPDYLRSRQVNTTQTNKNRYARWQNVKDQFYLNDTKLLSKASILLVDDVITTGATLLACHKTLSQCKDLKISIATMAFTS